MAAGEFLPPVVTRLIGNIDDLRDKILEAKALMASLDDKEVTIRVRTVGIGGDIRGAIAQIEKLKAAMAGLDSKTVRIAVDGLGAAAGGAAAGRLLGGFGWFGLTANAIHWIIAGGAEIAAVVVPAMIAAASWAMVWLQGAVSIGQHMEAVYTATEATAAMFHMTAGQAVGLGNSLQKAQDAATPNVMQAFGAAIKIAQERASGLATTGLQLGRVFDTFTGKLVGDFAKGGTFAASLDQILGHMVADATGVGQVFGNLGHILLQWGGQMPGLAEVLLRVLSFITRMGADVLDLGSRFRVFGLSLVTVYMAFEEFNRWGSLVISGLSRMGLASAATGSYFFGLTRPLGVLRGLFDGLTGIIGRVMYGLGGLIGQLGGVSSTAAFAGAKLRNAGADLTYLSQGLSSFEVAGIVVAIAAIGISVGVLIDKLVTARSQWQTFVDAQQAAVSKASNLNVLDVIAQKMGYLSSATAVAASSTGTFEGVTVQATKGSHSWNEAIAANRAEMASLATQYVGITGHAAYLASLYRTSLPGAMVLAQQAGVKLADTLTGPQWAAAKIQIASLVQGYRSMGAPAGAVGADMTALAIQSGLAATKVSQLNQAWDQFMQNLTGGTATVAGFEQSLTNLGQGTNRISTILGRGGSVSLAVRSFAQDLTSFTGKGAQAWQNFDQVVGNTAPQITDWLRTAGAEGAISGGQFQRAILAMAGQLVPFAKDSKVAQAQVMGLVDQAGLGIKTFPQLVAALKNGKITAKDLADAVSAATIKMGDMSGVAAQLGNVLQQDIIATMGAAAIKASGLSQATYNYLKALQAQNAGTGNASHALTVLQGILHGLGYTTSQTDGMVRQLGHDIFALPSFKRIRIGVTTVYSSVGSPGTINSTGGGGGGNHINSGTGYAGGTSGAAAGWGWVGEMGPELVRFRGGEQVIPNHVATRYAGGTGGASPAGGKFEAHVYLDGHELQAAVASLTFNDNVKNGNRAPDGRPRGTFTPRPVR